jgi:hypothetical protein
MILFNLEPGKKRTPSSRPKMSFKYSGQWAMGQEAKQTRQTASLHIRSCKSVQSSSFSLTLVLTYKHLALGYLLPIEILGLYNLFGLLPT